MTISRAMILAAMVSALAVPAVGQGQDEQFFRQLDSNGNDVIDREEYDINKGAILYALDKNRSLALEQRETKLSPDVFRRYAGSDNTIDGLELFSLPGTQFEEFDQDGDREISVAEFHRELDDLRGAPQAAEGQ